MNPEDCFQDCLREAAAEAMDCIFDTFKRAYPLRFYKIQQEEVVMLDPDYNADFENNQIMPQIVNQTPQFEEFEARVWYGKFNPNQYFVAGASDLNIKGKINLKTIKIQVREEAFEYLKDTKTIYFLGEKYFIKEEWRRVGILGEFQFYEVVLQWDN